MVELVDSESFFQKMNLHMIKGEKDKGSIFVRHCILCHKWEASLASIFPPKCSSDVLYTWRHKSCAVCHSGLDVESSFSWIPAFEGITTLGVINAAMYNKDLSFGSSTQSLDSMIRRGVSHLSHQGSNSRLLYKPFTLLTTFKNKIL